MASASSLLKSAASRRQKIQDQQDALVAYEYSQSAKTYDDFNQYAGYLKDQQKTADPSKALTLEKTLNSAQTSYISNEVQRQTINVMEGNADNKVKQQKLTSLYYQAANSGNYDLAQSLRSQIDSLSITIQNEAETKAAAGQALASKMATLNANSVSDAIDTVKGYVKELGDLYKTAGPEEFSKQIQGYAKDLGLNPGAGFFDVLTNLANSAVGIYDNAIASETDPGNIRTFTQDRNKLVQGNSFDLPGANGKTVSVSLQDLKDQADAQRVGNELISTVQTADGTVFKKNSTTGFVFGRDENGNYRQIPLYGNAPDYTSKVVKTDAKGNPVTDGSTYNYKDVLAKNGITATNQNGYLTIQNNGQIPGFLPGQEIQAYVGSDGQLQVSNGSDVYNFNFDPTGTFKGLEKYNPSAITQFNGGTTDANGFLSGDARFNTPYYQGKDLSSYGDLGSLVGVVDQNLAARYTSVGNFSGAGTVGSLNLSKPQQVLQPVATPQVSVAPQMTATPQATITPQTTLNPFNLPNVPKLAVSAPIPTPQIAVTAPTPTKPLSVTPTRTTGLVVR